jgi:hypothetical protein
MIGELERPMRQNIHPPITRYTPRIMRARNCTMSERIYFVEFELHS